MSRLSTPQLAALRHVEAVARRAQGGARARIADVLARSGCHPNQYVQALECIREHARIVLHFHPDRLGSKSMTVAEALLEDGTYRNQFETGISSGSLSAFPGGERDVWEKKLFASAYHAEEVNNSDRPKYGALELVRFPDGPIPRFGSCYFILRRSVAERTSFTFMGSEDPHATERLGTFNHMDSIMEALFVEIEKGGMARPPWPPYRTPTLGVTELTVHRLLNILLELAHPRKDPASEKPGRVLDTGIEAQVHGPIDLRCDLELLVADPSFALTDTGAVLGEIARRYDIPLRWHCGFQLAVLDVPDNFRGEAMPRLARRIAAINGTLDAAVIGCAAASLHRHPEVWQDWGNREDTLQHLKQLWHVLVHYGTAPERRGI
ncbi:DUF3626 domain-containing protein [Bradyrhizobium sp. USDA 10063]